MMNTPSPRSDPDFKIPRCVTPPPRENECEVECNLCALDPVCALLDYGSEQVELAKGVLFRRQRVARGETLFRSGDPFHSLFAVKSGSFIMLHKKEHQPDQVAGFQFAGDLIGADGMAGEHYPCTVRALEPSSVCELRMARLQRPGRSLEAFQRGIIAILGQEIAFCHGLHASLVRQNGEQRLAAFFLSLSSRHRARGMPELEFKLTMTRSDIASYLGLSRETVTRGLSRLQQEGTIRVSGKRVRLERVDLLECLAGNTPGA